MILIVFTFEHLSWRCLPSQYMHGFSSNLPFVLKLIGGGCMWRGWVFVSEALSVGTRTSSTTELVSFSCVSWLFSLVSISWQSAVRKSFREQSAWGFVLNIVQLNCSGNFFSSIGINRLSYESVWIPRSCREISVVAAHQLRAHWFLKAISYAHWLDLVFFRSVLSAFQWLFHSFVTSLVALKSRARRCRLSILSNSSFSQYCSVQDCCVLRYYDSPKT